jgi:cytochrome c-type biogenesis protein CcmH
VQDVKRWAPWIALAVVVVVALVVVVVRSRPSDSPAARAERLTRELACPVCEGQSVADSNAPESREIRADIPRRIAAGQSDADIRAFYVSRYGSHILLTPANGGIGLVAWMLPVGALLLGALGLVVAFRRWSRTPRLAATAEDEAIVQSAREAHE